MKESLFDTNFTSVLAIQKSEMNNSQLDNNELSIRHKSETKNVNNNQRVGNSFGENQKNNHQKRTTIKDIAISNNENIKSGSNEKINIILPSIDDNSKYMSMITLRALVSTKESGCLIGQNGQFINYVRSQTNTKAGISKLQYGTNERILTIIGTIDNCANALSYFTKALCNCSFEPYQNFPLKQLSSNPCIKNETTILRLLIPNSQMGTLMGSKGIKIQQIQSQCKISMIVSKSSLPDSNERLVELQGTVNNIFEAVKVITRCLIEIFPKITTTNFYVPKKYNYMNNLSKNKSRQITTTLNFPNDIVGALIGKNGSRIQGVRKITSASIAISNEQRGKLERVFTITGTLHSVEKAKRLLYHNLNRETQRRAEVVKNS